jgi:DtxR family Mn-dependent transcriptional regulator
MRKRKKLSESQEDYLEAIYEIENRKKAARAKDIAERLNVTSASVTGALRVLAERDLVNHEPYDLITLTPEGRTIAEGVSARHRVLYDFFHNILEVPEDIAGDCACHMEHAMPDSVLKKFLTFVDFVKKCQYGGANCAWQKEDVIRS